MSVPPLDLVHQKRGVALGAQMTAIGEQPPQQNNPGDFAEGEPEVRLEETQSAQVRAFGDGDTHPDAPQGVGTQQPAAHALP
jgi:hypothetical protein